MSKPAILPDDIKQALEQVGEQCGLETAHLLRKRIEDLEAQLRVRQLEADDELEDLAEWSGALV